MHSSLSLLFVNFGRIFDPEQHLHLLRGLFVLVVVDAADGFVPGANPRREQSVRDGVLLAAGRVADDGPGQHGDDRAQQRVVHEAQPEDPRHGGVVVTCGVDVERAVGRAVEERGESCRGFILFGPHEETGLLK